MLILTEFVAELRSVRQALFGNVFHLNPQSFVWRRHVRAHPNGNQDGGGQVTGLNILNLFLPLKRNLITLER